MKSIKNKKHFYLLLVTIALTLLFGNGIILSAQEPDYTSFKYDAWKQLSVMEKYIYVIAYHQAIWAMSWNVEELLGNTYLSKEMDSMLPGCSNKEIVEGINYIYSVEEFKELPVFYIIIEFNKLIRLTEAYYEQQYRKGDM